MVPTVARQLIQPWQAAIAGLVAAAAALGTSELVAGLVPGAASLVLSVGRAVIDLQPPGAKDFVVGLFGTNDKLALEIAVVVVSLAIGAGLGVLALRRPGLAAAAFVAFAALGFLASLRDPAVSPAIAAAVAGAAAIAGVQVLQRLVALLGGGPAERAAGAATPDWRRRTFLVRTAGLAVGAVVAGAAGRVLLERQRLSPGQAAGHLPLPGEVASLPPGAELAVAGLTPLVVPNDEFYRIDTALIVPNVDLPSWRLRIHGLVERETTLPFDELVALGTVEQYVTIACVSNEVGGDLVGNAKWTGVRLREVLGLAGVRPEATQLVGRAVDGWTAGMPTAWVMDESREPLVAVQMNDAPLPLAHGFPARLIVPGLFGYVSATKWLAELELTTWEAFDAYWVPLGWAKEGPILTQSRIDVPRSRATLGAGRTTIAGVAWAPDRGIAGVEVAVDGAWQPATISRPISDATWVQWRLDWEAVTGQHTLAVRATDGDGTVQTDQHSRPAPDGARGHHTIRVTIE
ncbi:MAG TPA: molybdopterin-dependent oxidoreductase [Candidatus Limnocylindrales bacterium]|jgi:DMSO/TMAO reductase YedYZ molybdopterin-dependent catalytic subunit|nr:molybdopterin-dependent oxidoreductase [Candidatus Limnocylindrales bacterium]